MNRFLPFLVAALALASTACEDNPCTEPRKIDELHARFDERSNEWLEDAEPYPLQLEKFAEKRAQLRPLREKLVRERETHTNQMIDAFIKDQPDVPTIHTLVKAAQKSSMTYGWKLFDLAFELHPLFTTPQRQKIVDALSEPPEKFSTPFLARRAIDYVMFKIDADDAQKKAVDDAVSRTENKINVLILEQEEHKKTILGQWTAKDPDLSNARKAVQTSSDEVTQFVHQLVDQAARLATRFRPEQRTFVNDRLTRMKTCPAQ